jgi:hypothetical protein
MADRRVLTPDPRSRTRRSCETGRPNFALLEIAQKDALGPARQEALQVGLAHRQRQVAQVVAIHREDVEGQQLGLVIVLAGVQDVEVGIAVDAADNGLAIDDEMLLPVLEGCFNDQRIALCPVIAALGDQPDAVGLALQAQR